MKTAKIEVFKAGVYGNNESRVWNEIEVKEIVDNYDASYRNAPVILGHNDWDGKEKPAYGWALGFSINEKKVLIAEIEYNDDLGELVDKKMYTQVSMELTKKIELYDRDGNKKGAYALAIALLGSNQPAVSGLSPISFSVEDGKNGNSFVNTLAELCEESECKFKKDDIIPNIENFEIKSEEDFMSKEFIDEIAKLKADKADSDAKFKIMDEENQKFKKELKDKQTDMFMQANALRIIPTASIGIKKFLNENEDGVCESFKKIIEAFPENAIFTNGEDSENENTTTDSDEKFALQAEKDMAILRKGE